MPARASPDVKIPAVKIRAAAAWSMCGVMICVAIGGFDGSSASALSIPMPLALEVIGLRKRFRAGAGSCTGTVSVLRGLDLEVRSGESVSIVGEPGSGRSTLLLCLAGLLGPDEGVLRWFGDERRAVAAHRARYHLSCDELSSLQESGPQQIHLLDLGDFAAGRLDHLREWIVDRTRMTGTVVMSVESFDIARRLTSRALALRDGRLTASPRTQVRVRVAEEGFVDHSFERV